MKEIKSLIDDDIKENIDHSAICVKFAMMSKQIENKDKEIERLNNIINELEKELKKDFNTYLQKNTTMRETGKTYKAGANNYRMHIYLKLQELKGSDKE